MLQKRFHEKSETNATLVEAISAMVNIDSMANNVKSCMALTLGVPYFLGQGSTTELSWEEC